MKKSMKATALILAAAVLVFGFAGCNKSDSDDTHYHTYDSENWSYNTEEHWHAATCGHDGMKDSEAEHDFSGGFVVNYNEDGTASGTMTVTCSVCGFKETIDGDGTHVHTYESSYKWDENCHWNPASCGHEDLQGNITPHTFKVVDNGDETETKTCTICGYSTTVSADGNHIHTFSSDLTYDKTYHWHASTCIHGNVVSDKAEHVYVVVDGSEYISNNDATAEADGTKTRTCSQCGYKETVIDPGTKTHTHTYSDEWYSSASQHWKECTTCTGTNPGMTELAAHTWDEGVSNGDGTDTYTCTVCGRKSVGEHVHKYAEKWTSDDDKHWHKCTGCDSISDEETHKWERDSVPYKPTYFKSGMEIDKCSVCGEMCLKEISELTPPQDYVAVKGCTVYGSSLNKCWGNNDYAGAFVEGRNVPINDFLICKYEVCQGEFSSYVMKTGWTSSLGAYWGCPAYYINWYEALRYCNLRSIAEGLDPCYKVNGETDPIADWPTTPRMPTQSRDTYETNVKAWRTIECDFAKNGYRLPTEAEWEYAARGGHVTVDTDKWYWEYAGADSTQTTAPKKDSALDNLTFYDGHPRWSWDMFGGRAEVPGVNALGIQAMSGNVWEWCWDYWSSKITSSTPERGPTKGDYRVARGGCISSFAKDVSVTKRIGEEAGTWGYTGFRVVRTITGNEFDESN